VQIASNPGKYDDEIGRNSQFKCIIYVNQHVAVSFGGPLDSETLSVLEASRKKWCSSWVQHDLGMSLFYNHSSINTEWGDVCRVVIVKVEMLLTIKVKTF
jgi:putative AlgH/UPF0301 family transcriptional regulator